MVDRVSRARGRRGGGGYEVETLDTDVLLPGRSAASDQEAEACLELLLRVVHVSQRASTQGRVASREETREAAKLF